MVVSFGGGSLWSGACACGGFEGREAGWWLCGRWSDIGSPLGSDLLRARERGCFVGEGDLLSLAEETSARGSSWLSTGCSRAVAKSAETVDSCRVGPPFRGFLGESRSKAVESRPAREGGFGMGFGGFDVGSEDFR